MGMNQNLGTLVNPKIAGKWMFIPLELIIIGFDPPPYRLDQTRIRYLKKTCLALAGIGECESNWLLLRREIKKSNEATQIYEGKTHLTSWEF